MEHKDKTVYPGDKVYLDEEVLAVTPEDLYKWMCFRIYGNEDPVPNMTPKYRSSAIEYWKKGVSYFMNTTSKWNEGSRTGNATQSKKVNNLINAVKKAETRGTGQETVADMAFTMVEF